MDRHTLIRVAVCFLALGAAVAPAADTDTASPKPPADTTAPPPTTRSADENPNPRQEIAALLARARQRLANLKLSDEQKQKIDGFFTKAEEDFKAAAAELKDATRLERFKRFTSIVAKLRQDVRSVLNDEQIKQLPTAVENGAGKAADGFNRLRQALGQLELSDEQQAQIQDLMHDARAQIDKLRAEGSQAGQDVRAKLREVGDELREKLQATLSDTQKQKLHELMEAPATQPATDGK